MLSGAPLSSIEAIHARQILGARGNPTVEVEVVLDEAVTLAKRYASDDAGRLVNGILGRILREAGRGD